MSRLTEHNLSQASHRLCSSAIGTRVNQPNVVIVVLDCVRASDFPPPLAPGHVNDQFIASLFRESTSFSRAVAPACWTLPSHASILTGLYPWDHRVHGKGAATLPDEITPISQELQMLGYRTQFLSGNPILQDETGFHRGFEDTQIAEFWEPLVRFAAIDESHLELLRSRKRIESLLRGPLGRVQATLAASELLAHFPLVLDLRNRVLYKLTDSRGHEGLTSPWIEGRFKKFLEETPRDQRVFSLINLFDAHEPYLTDETAHYGLTQWLRRMGVPQQMSLILAGKHKPNSNDGEILHELYLASIRQLMRRISRLIETLVNARRWEETLFILTSDHGQAFLEHGHLFHGFTLDEPVVRVPLLIKSPNRSTLMFHHNQWISLVDIPRFVRQTAGLAPSSNLKYDRLGSRTNSGPVFTFSDGIIHRSFARRWLSPRRFSLLDRVQVAAYVGRHKLIMDSSSHQVSTYEVVNDATETSLEEVETGPEGTVSKSIQGAFEQILLRVDSTPLPSHCVESRLAGWGYT